MKLYYTAIGQDLTKALARLAETYAQEGYRVFYLAPNSLSFEKEKKVLQALSTRASFAITVTRFSQLARYLMLKTSGVGESLDPRGLTMVVHRVLSQLTDAQLQVYGQLRQDRAFVQQVVDFYQECQAAQLRVEDLTGLSPAKQADLKVILDQVELVLGDLGKTSQSPLAQLTARIQSNQLDVDLSRTVVIVDGFTRFTGEEKALLVALNQSCKELVVGVYASPKAYKSTYLSGNLYQASVDFLRGLAQEFATQPTQLTGDESQSVFADLSEVVERQFDYRLTEGGALPQLKERLQLWEALSPKQELEEVAKAIRRRLQEGHRYKDMVVLLGKVDQYQDHIKQVFDRYAIPYYLGKAEPMTSHPLVQLVESLERLLRYQFRAEDWINLMTLGLYGSCPQEDLDALTRYVTYADLQGLRAFSQPFRRASKRFDLDKLNQTRQDLMAPLQTFLAQGAGKGEALLAAFQVFIEEGQVRTNLSELAAQGTLQEAERHAEVWKQFSQLLEQFHLIFAGTDLTLSQFLGIISAGLQEATYRLVPATVDVVTVKSYQLIEPHTNKFVYAIGLSQANFPEVVLNASLISDEERLLINQNLPEGQELDLSSQDTLKRNHYIFASLLNSASQELVLSSPAKGEEGEDSRSTYLSLLVNLGLPIRRFGPPSLTPKAGDLGSFRGLLASFARAYQLGQDLEADQGVSSGYWTVLARMLAKTLEEEGLTNLADALLVKDEAAQSRPVSQEVLAVRYPKGEPFYLSASALKDFYNNQYLYFVRHVLKLVEEESIHPDARHHGIFMHRVLELWVKEKGDLASIMTQVNQEPFAQLAYQNNAQDQFSRQLLEEMLTLTASLLKTQSGVLVEQEELAFRFQGDKQLLLPDERPLVIRGKIDRLDRLEGKEAYGVVDYKSGSSRFQLKEFYNKLSPQLLTYLSALKAAGHSDHYGAFYLQVTKPQVSLTTTYLTPEAILKEVDKTLAYKGLVNEAHWSDLTGFPKSDRLPRFSPEDLALLVAYNDHLYHQAAASILAGHFAINPYSRDGKTVSGEQLKNLTRFEADSHLGQARQLIDFGLNSQSKDFREQVLEAMRTELGWPSSAPQKEERKD